MDEPREAQRRRALKRHHRKADHVGGGFVDQAPHRLGDVRLRQNEIGDDHAMVRVDVAGERRQRTVRHADGDRRHVLERIRHAQQEHIHRVLHALAAAPSASARRFRSELRRTRRSLGEGGHPRRELTLMPRLDLHLLGSAWPRAMAGVVADASLADRYGCAIFRSGTSNTVPHDHRCHSLLRKLRECSAG